MDSNETCFSIFSDSRSCLDAICGGQSNHPLIRRIHNQISSLNLSRKSIHFCWCPAHIGVFGNERADSLAKEATVQDDLLLGLPYTDFLPKIMTAMRRRWQNKWTANLDDKHSEVKLLVTPWKAASFSNR